MELDLSKPCEEIAKKISDFLAERRDLKVDIVVNNAG